MKLTCEGAARLGRHESRGFPVSDFDFKPEDFDGCFQNGKGHIVLTVEEAKGILWDLRDLYKQTYGYEWVKNEPWFDEFKKRIQQAEKGHEVE